MTNLEKWNELSDRLSELEAYFRVIGKVNFDMECCAPPEGMERAGEDMAVLGKQIGQVSAVIAELTDYDESLCLSLRYIKLLPWRAVADAMGLSQRQVARIHLRALEHIKIPTE